MTTWPAAPPSFSPAPTPRTSSATLPPAAAGASQWSATRHANILRVTDYVSDAELGPGDDFCITYHLFDMIPEGVTAWSPKYAYAAA